MVRLSTRRTLLVLGAFVALSVLPTAQVHVARSGHSTRWVTVIAPFSGYWDKYGQSPPATHHDPLTAFILGDWATDFYQIPGTTGRWYSAMSDGSLYTAKVFSVTNACNAGSWTTAGLRYQIDLRDNTNTKIGHWGYIHVDPRSSSGAQYWLSSGVTLAQGMKIGYTHQYSYLAGCWEVSNDAGVHWHIVGYNVHAYSCWYPWTSGTNPGPPWGSTLTVGQDGMGAVGANATGPGQPCW